MKNDAFACGEYCKAYGNASYALGSQAIAFGGTSFSMGDGTLAKGARSFAAGVGRLNTAGEELYITGNEGSKEISFTGTFTPRVNDVIGFVDDENNQVFAQITAVSSNACTLDDELSHSATNVLAKRYRSAAYAEGSHVEGDSTRAFGVFSHAEGFETIAVSNYQHVQGRCNIADDEKKYAHIVGNGGGATSRSNAHTLDWTGNAWFAGTVEGTALILKSSTSGSTKRFKIIVDDTGTLTATEVTT